jgi:hypothetical protein
MTESPVVTGSLLFELADRLRDRLIERVNGQASPEGFALHLADGTPIGSVEVWRSDRVRIAVEVRLADPVRGLAASMLHAFSPRASQSPHLVCDMALLGHKLAVGADLVPRADPADTPDWATQAWGPLLPVHDLYLATPGVSTTSDVSARLRWLCSPWLLTTAQGFENTDAAERMLEAVVDRFAELSGQTWATADGRGADRDRRYLQALFAEQTDPVWEVMSELIGEPTRDRLVSLMVDG